MNKHTKALKILSLAVVLLTLSAVFCFAEPGWSDDPTSAPTAPPTVAPTAPPTTAPATRPATTAPQTTARNSNSAGSRSSDNSLRTLSVVGKTENGETVNVNLNPVFSSSVYNYNITVPFEVVRLEVTAVANDDDASITIPASLLAIDVGADNRTEVVVRAENGSTRRYVINTVRNEQVETTTQAETTTETTEKIEPATLIDETTTAPEVVAQNNGLFENTYAKLGVVFGVGGLALLVLALIMLNKRKKNVGGDAE